MNTPYTAPRPWSQYTGMIIKAIWIYTIAGIFGAIFGAIDRLLNPVSILAALAGEDMPGSTFGTLDTICQILVIAGYALFFLNIKKFVDIQRTDADRKAVKDIYIAYILLIVAIVADFIPVIGGIAWLVLMIIGYVKLLSGFKALKTSATWTDDARSGAGLIYSSTIWLLVGAVISIIPFVGGFLNALITLVIFFTILRGWKKIQAGGPAETAAPAQPKPATADSTTNTK